MAAICALLCFHPAWRSVETTGTLIFCICLEHTCLSVQGFINVRSQLAVEITRDSFQAAVRDNGSLMVKTLDYCLENREFKSQRCHWIRVFAKCQKM